MSNKSRRQRVAAGPLTGRHKLSPAAKLETLELYIQYHNVEVVGQKFGVSGAAIRSRLHVMGVRLLPPGGSTNDVVAVNGQEVIDKLKRELRVAIKNPARAPEARLPWTADEDAIALQKDRSVESIAAELGRTVSSVNDRRYRLRGGRDR